jgi:phosphohistidine phosphatase SixA
MEPLVVLVTLVAAGASAAPAPQAELIENLRRGGYVLVMRHAHAPREAPAKEQAHPDNVRLERQLDEAGRQGATAMGDAIRTQRIPIGAVFSSPTYRALQTVTLARLGDPTIVDQLGDGGQSMQGVTEAQAERLRARVAQPPASGNTILVTHQPNLSRAFPEWGGTVADGETVVLRPDGNGSARVIGRIRIDAWPR